MVGRLVTTQASFVGRCLRKPSHLPHAFDHGRVTNLATTAKKRMRRRNRSRAVDRLSLGGQLAAKPDQRDDSQNQAKAQPPTAETRTTLKVVQVVSSAQPFRGASSSQWWLFSHSAAPLRHECRPKQAREMPVARAPAARNAEYDESVTGGQGRVSRRKYFRGHQ